MSNTQPLQLGDRIKDNDPRVGHRVLFVIEVTKLSVFAEDSRGNVRGIAPKRIHTDGKPRRSGFSLLPRNEE